MNSGPPPLVYWVLARAAAGRSVDPRYLDCLGEPWVTICRVALHKNGLAPDAALDLALSGRADANAIRSRIFAVDPASEPPAMPNPTSGRTRAEAIAEVLAGVRTGAELGSKTFEPTREIVEGFVYEGLNLVAGREKSGKTLMLLDIGLAVASGSIALGSLGVEPGDALFLELEIGERKLREYGDALLRGSEWPTGFEYATRWLQGDLGGIEAIVEWLDKHPKARLVCIDTLQAFRPGPKPGHTLNSLQGKFGQRGGKSFSTLRRVSPSVTWSASALPFGCEGLSVPFVGSLPL